MTKFRTPLHFTNEQVFEPLGNSGSASWHLEYLGLNDPVFDKLNGTGVTIAILDTGVNWHHPVLEGAKIYREVAKGYTYTPGSHGTGVVSLLAGNGTYGIKGIVPDAQIISIQVLDKYEMGSFKAVAKGYEIARKMGVDIISTSLGSPKRSKEVMREVNKCLSDGIFIVAAGGNSGNRGGVMWPAKSPRVLCTGASDRSGQVSSFSSADQLGDIDILAPGSFIKVASNGKGYDRKSGTSFACPIVAGIAGLVKENGTNLSIDLFTNNAKDLLEEGEDTLSGFGIVDPLSMFGSH